MQCDQVVEQYRKCIALHYVSNEVDLSFRLFCRQTKQRNVRHCNRMKNKERWETNVVVRHALNSEHRASRWHSPLARTTWKKVYKIQDVTSFHHLVLTSQQHGGNIEGEKEENKKEKSVECIGWQSWCSRAFLHWALRFRLVIDRFLCTAASSYPASIHQADDDSELHLLPSEMYAFRSSLTKHNLATKLLWFVVNWLSQVIKIWSSLWEYQVSTHRATATDNSNVSTVRSIMSTIHHAHIHLFTVYTPRMQTQATKRSPNN